MARVKKPTEIKVIETQEDDESAFLVVCRALDISCLVESMDDVGREIIDLLDQYPGRRFTIVLEQSREN